MRIFKNKKAIMGIGMLMIFISTVLVSSLAAGVLIRSTGLLQQRALFVEESTRERLSTGVEVVGLYILGNKTAETFTQFEIIIRTRAGSPAIQMRTTGLSFVSNDNSFTADLNESLIGSGCQFANLTTETSYCYDTRVGNDDTILEDGELFTVRYHIDQSAALGTEDPFEINIQPKSGALEVLELSTPELVLSNKVRLR